jgi:hypothetical protein
MVSYGTKRKRRCVLQAENSGSQGVKCKNMRSPDGKGACECKKGWSEGGMRARMMKWGWMKKASERDKRAAPQNPSLFVLRLKE